MLQRTRGLTYAVAALMMWLASSAGAQTTQPETPRPTRQDQAATSEGLLAGPRVRPEDMGLDGGGFGLRGRGRDRPRQAITWRRWIDLLDTADLSDEQRDGLREVSRQLEQARAAFEEAHGQELRRLRREVRQARQAGQRPDRALTRKIQRLQGAAPNPVAFQKRSWSLLTDEQRDQMRRTLSDMRRRAREQRAAEEATAPTDQPRRDTGENPPRGTPDR